MKNIVVKPSVKIALAISAFIIIVLVLWGSRVSSPAYGHASGFTPYYNRRFGFGVTYEGGNPTQYNIEPLNAGWFWDWSARKNASLPGLEYIRTIRLKPDGDSYTPSLSGDRLLAVINANPGATWSIANEPDCVWMDNMVSYLYARAYHDLYYFIKEADPTAKVAAGSIVQPTPQRINYLNRVLEAYRLNYDESLPADLWITHNYTLCENCWPKPQPGDPFAWGACRVPDWPNGSDVDTYYSVQDHWKLEPFAERIVRMRQWMYDNGYQNMPLLISEYGILFYDGLVSGKTVQDNIDFMNTTFDWMRETRDPVIGYPADDYRLVQRWAWFSLDHDGWYMGGELFNYQTHEPKALANAYAAYTDQVPPATDIHLLGINAATHPTSNSSTFTATLDARLSNAGNVEPSTPMTVTFYLSQTTSVALDRVVVKSLGCCGNQQIATGLLSNLGWEDKPQVFVEVDTDSGTLQSPVMTLQTDVRIEETWAPTMYIMSKAHMTGTVAPVTGTLYAKIVNAGAISTASPVTVTFYPEQTATMPIGRVKIAPPLAAHGSEIVTLSWPNIYDGIYPYCVTAQISNLVLEPVCSELIVIDLPYHLYAPAVLRSY
jgi:hypothetical protein